MRAGAVDLLDTLLNDELGEQKDRECYKHLPPLRRLVHKLRTIADLDELDALRNAPTFGYRPQWSGRELEVIHSRRDWLIRNQRSAASNSQQNNGNNRIDLLNPSTNDSRKQR